MQHSDSGMNKRVLWNLAVSFFLYSLNKGTSYILLYA